MSKECKCEFCELARAGHFYTIEEYKKLQTQMEDISSVYVEYCQVSFDDLYVPGRNNFKKHVKAISSPYSQIVVGAVSVPCSKCGVEDLRTQVKIQVDEDKEPSVRYQHEENCLSTEVDVPVIIPDTRPTKAKSEKKQFKRQKVSKQQTSIGHFFKKG